MNLCPVLPGFSSLSPKTKKYPVTNYEKKKLAKQRQNVDRGPNSHLLTFVHMLIFMPMGNQRACLYKCNEVLAKVSTETKMRR